MTLRQLLFARDGYRLAWPLACLAALTLTLATSTWGIAQEATEPAAGDEPAAEEPAAEPAAEEPAMDAGEEPAVDEAMAEEPAEEEPAEAAPPTRKAKGAKAEEQAPAALADPAVLAILESHPTTPAELLRAIDILVDLKQAPLAKPMVDELAGRKLDLAAKAALAERFHSAKLLKLARNAELGAVLGPFIDDVLKSAEEYRHDAARLTEWARQLSDPNEATRAQAIVALLRAREAAVAPLVRILADPKRKAEYPAARAALLHLNDLAVEPLLGVLESPDSALKTEVVEVLGQLKAHQAVPQLLAAAISTAGTPELRAAAARALANIGGRAPSAADTVQLLDRAARRSLDQSKIEDLEGSAVEIWHWNPKRGESMPVSYDPSAAQLASAVRLSRDLYLLDPHNPSHRRLYLTALLQAAKYRVGLAKPLPSGSGTSYSVAARWGAEVVEDVLASAMAAGYVPAATAAAQILGDVGSVDLLRGNGAAPRPLAAAANHADRRLRFAAIEAIMKLKPTEPFAGSSHVADGLGFFASSYGVPRVLIVHPRSDEGRTIAGLASQLGYEADVATNGRKAFEAATASPDYEFVLIHSAVQRPAADELCAQLRRDRRTALLPVGLMAPWDDLERVKRFATSAPRVEAVLEPHDEAQMKLLAAEVLARAGRSHVTSQERRAQAAAALDWLVALGHAPQRVFDLRKQEAAMLQVLYVPEMTAGAASVLADVGGVRAQQSLIELANQPTQPLAARQAAVAAFVRNMRAYGLLLSRDLILHEYDLFNANAGRDADTHAVLGAILDALERKSDARTSD